MADEPDVDPRVDELFTLPPEEFTAARNALVKALRGEGRREEATEVGGLRRPTVAAWAINQAVRTHRDGFDDLVAAGGQVRAAQRRALSGVRQSGMREATRARRTAIEALADTAGAILAERGVAADSHRGDIVATFDAASADDDAAAVVGAARLSATLPVASGFGALDGLHLVAPPDTRPPAEAQAPPAEAEAPPADDADDAADDGAEQEERARRDEARAQARRAAMKAVADARRRLTDAQGTADRAAAEASRATARADAADRTAAVAEDKARRLRTEADELAARASRADRRAGDARRTAEQLADELETREQELATLDV